MRLLYLLLVSSFFFSVTGQAQNTGGIFPPMVNEGHRSFQYRITYATESEAAVQRIHYQQAINDDFMWRVLAQASTTDADPFKLQLFQGELFWDLSGKNDRWKTGLRFDGRLRTSWESGMLGLHWTNQVAVTDDWHARFVVLNSYNVGPKVTNEIGFQTRGSIFMNLDVGPVIGVEFYNSYGTLRDLHPFDEQKHQIGPFAFIPASERFNIFVGTLMGLTDATEPLELRLWVTYTF